MTRLLPVHERFASFQGEGIHMGRSAFFIRTYGCPLKCPWCDSAGTWHPDFKPVNGFLKMEAKVLIEEALQKSSFIVVTGGEPAVHNLRELTELARQVSLPIHIETSGAFPIIGSFDWITVSPKHSKVPLRENVEMADEFKFIIERPEDIQYWLDFVTANGYNKQPIWLHPEWSKRNDREVLDAITQAASTHGRYGTFRAGWQLHKLYKADTLDTRSAPSVPLGGNAELGY